MYIQVLVERWDCTDATYSYIFTILITLYTIKIVASLSVLFGRTGLDSRFPVSSFCAKPDLIAHFPKRWTVPSIPLTRKVSRKLSVTWFQSLLNPNTNYAPFSNNFFEMFLNLLQCT